MQPAVAKPGFRLGSSFRVAWTPTADRLVALGRRVAVWDVAARKKIGSVKPFSNESHVDVSPVGDRCVVKNTAGSIAVLDIESALVRLLVPGDESGEGCDVLFAPDGEMLVDGTWQGDLLLRDATTGELALRERGDQLTAIATTPDRSLWAYIRHDTLWLRRWPFDVNKPEATARVGALVSSVAIDAKGRVLVASSDRLELWEAGAARYTFDTAISGTGVRAAWGPDGTVAAYAGAKSVAVLDEQLSSIWHAELEYPSDVAFSPDGALLAAGDWSKGFVIRTPAA